MYKYIYRKIINKFFLNNQAFTLVELMVVISIFLIITSIVIFNYGNFRSSVSLQNLTDNVALSIRKAQSFAIGARGIGSHFSDSYGVHFSVNNTIEALNSSKKTFLIFSTNSLTSGYTNSMKTGSCGDINNNNCFELLTIPTADIIKSITLNNGTSVANGSYLDIIFTRPDPGAYFCYTLSIGGACQSPSTISSVDIVVSNNLSGSDEKTKTISIQNTGQISIQ